MCVHTVCVMEERTSNVIEERGERGIVKEREGERLTHDGLYKPILCREST